jgi:hypothetical protein
MNESQSPFNEVVIPSEAEGSRHETFKVTQRDPSLSLGMTGGRSSATQGSRELAPPKEIEDISNKT